MARLALPKAGTEEPRPTRQCGILPSGLSACLQQVGQTMPRETMPVEAHAEEVLIKALLEDWADAVRRHDLPAILAHHGHDMVMFDLPPPLQCKGIDAYARTWDLFFRYHKPGTPFAFRELAVTASAWVAFAVAII